MNRRVLAAVFTFFAVVLLPNVCTSQNLLNAPQKIVIDAARNRLLVSNYNNGALVQIDSAGKQSYFVQSAGFVDGLEVVGDVVYGVGNNRKVYGYDLISKRQVLNITISGPAVNYLSSITSDSAGHLFISCPLLNEIYKLRLSDYSYWVFARGNGLRKPNGILLEREKDRIVVIDDSTIPSLIHAISLSDSTVTTLASTNFNSPDGITRDKYGNHYIGGYYLSGIYKTDANFSYTPVKVYSANNMVYPTYDPSNHSLLVTLYESNSWRRIPLESSGIVSAELPEKLTVYPIFPNPGTTELSVKFDLEKRIRVMLEVYDLSGLRVARLIDEERDPGAHTIIWDGNDTTGNQAGNGIYFFRLSAGNDVQTQKGILFH